MKNAFRQCAKPLMAAFVTLLVFVISPYAVATDNDTAVLLAKIYNDDVDVTQYLVSEKFDGVRAIWNGRQLMTRQGNPIVAPVWFTAHFPTSPLDGELWIKRGAFDMVSGIVRKQTPMDADWQQVSYLIFELPNGNGDFSRRYQTLSRVIQAANVQHLKLIKQFKVRDKNHLKQIMASVVKAGGEGLMLHRANAIYETGRSDALLKLKPFLDAEAVVIAHLPGKGKYAGKMGALLVELPNGIQFKLGTGFTDAQREHPPAIGSTVTFVYQHKTKAGKPRFARYLRIRKE